MAASNRVKMRAIRRLAKLYPPMTLESRLEKIRQIATGEVDPTKGVGRQRVTRREVQPPTSDEGADVEVE